MAGVSDKELIPLGPWPAGIDNLNDETNLARSDDGKRVIALREAVNVDLPRTGWPRRRKGYERIVQGTRVHSLWAHSSFPFLLFADGASQYGMTPAGTPWQIRAGLAPREIGYGFAAGDVYCSNGTQAWRVDQDGGISPWAVESPAHQPTLTATSDGGLDAGAYQIAFTFLDAEGRESGTGKAVTVQVAAGGGIALTDIPQPTSPDVVRGRIYATNANGDVLQQARDVLTGQAQAMLGAFTPGRPLATQFLEPLPACDIVRTLGGRLYTARGNVMRWSEALRFGLSSLKNNVRTVGERIDVMEAVGEGTDGAGLFVSDHKRTYWFGGADPTKQPRQIAYGYGAVRGSSVIVPGNVFGLQTTMPVAYWIAANGVALLGLPGGQIVPLRERQVVAPAASRGASLFREADGIRQVITALSDAQPQGLAVRDRVSGRVYRNGVEV